MKIDNFSYILKGVILAFSGVLVAFFPGVINWLFYIVGGIVVFACVLSLLSSVFGGEGAFMFPAGILGAALGVGIMFLPRFISIQIPVIAGLVLAIMGVIRLSRGLKSDNSDGKKTLNIVLGCIFIVIGCILLFNPFKASKVMRIITGVVMMLFAAFNFYVAYVIKQRNDAYTPKIVDVEDFTIGDDHKQLK